MKKEKKAEVVKEMHEKLLRSEGVFLVDFKGLTVSEIMQVRAGVKEVEGELKVVKNTLLKIALEDTQYGSIEQFLTGNNAIVFSYGDPVAVAKQLVKSGEDFEHLTVKGGLIPGGEVFDRKGVEQLSKLPGKDELVGKLLYLFNYPVQGLVNVTSGLLRNFVVVIDQIRDKKEKEAA